MTDEEKNESTEGKKTPFIVSSEHAVIGVSGGQAVQVAPGERVPYDENADSHKYLRERIKKGDPDYAHLSFQEIDLKAEQDQKDELEEKLEEGRRIAAEQRQEEVRALEEQQEERSSEVDEETPPVDQLADAEPAPQDKESQRLAKKSGAGQRASTQEDTADEGDLAEPPPENKPRSRKAKSEE